MSIVLDGSAGITAPGVETFGNGTAVGGTTNPIVAMTGASTNYVQAYAVNNTNGTSSSADLVAYPSNGNDSHGWVDMGITSLAYADSTYTITGPNESYLFGSGPTGTTGTGNLVFGTDNTGTANDIQFYTGGFTQAKSAAKMVIQNSTGNVGIGTSSPAEKLQVAGGVRITGALVASQASCVGIDFNAGSARLVSYGTNTSTQGSFTFLTSNSNASTTNQVATIDTSGNLLVNATSAVSNEKLFVTTNASQNIIGARLGASGSNATCFLAGNATGATSFDYFGAYDGSGTKKAGITSAGTFQSATNTYGGTSDERLKENITDATPKLDDLLNVRIRNFNFIADEQKLKQIGVVAQELEIVFPALVEDTPTWNEQGESTGTVKNVKYSVFVPILIKAIQEQQAILSSQAEVITQLQADVAALKA